MSVLIMESDRDIRKLGDELDKLVKSKAVDLGLASSGDTTPNNIPIWT